MPSRLTPKNRSRSRHELLRSFKHPFKHSKMS